MNSNLKPFDIEEWRQTKRKIVTEQGYEVDIVHVDNALDYPIVGIVRDYPNENGTSSCIVNQWDLCGNDCECHRPNDLYFIASKEVRYCVIHNTLNGTRVISVHKYLSEAERVIINTPYSIGELTYEI